MRALLWLALLVAGACSKPQQGRLQPDWQPALLLVDRDAQVGGKRVAVFGLEADGSGLAPYLSGEGLVHPLDCMPLPDGRILVLDQGPDGEPGSLWICNPSRTPARKLRKLPLAPGLLDPCHLNLGPDGKLYITDRSAAPRSQPEPGQRSRKTGSLFRLDLAGLGRDPIPLELVYSGAPLQTPAASLFRDGKLYLLDADAFQRGGFKPGQDEGAIFGLALEGGERGLCGRIVSTLKLRGFVSPLDFLPAPGGAFYVVDVNRNHLDPASARGAVFLVGSEGRAQPFFFHKDLRDPPSALLHGAAMLVVDANADPLGLGEDGSKAHYAGKGRGAVYRVDLKDRRGQLFCASPMLCNPIRLRPLR